MAEKSAPLRWMGASSGPWPTTSGRPPSSASRMMIAVGSAMLRPRDTSGDPDVRVNPAIVARLVAIGLLVGAISGFFGIGGGFLIVPGIMLGSGMPILNAIGSSLFSVGAFGLTTAISYALSGLIDWSIVGAFIVGGVVGGLVGMKAALRLAARKQLLSRLFAGVLFLVAAYMAVHSGATLFGGG